ncbi:MAG: hypothetical protein Kow0059_15260 [Candidatus Sumerlaeia bacterium]
MSSLPVLGVALLFEALTLLVLMRDQTAEARGMMIALFVGGIAQRVRQGFFVGLATGMLIYYVFTSFGRSGGAGGRSEDEA